MWSDPWPTGIHWSGPGRKVKVSGKNLGKGMMKRRSWGRKGRENDRRLIENVDKYLVVKKYQDGWVRADTKFSSNYFSSQRHSLLPAFLSYCIENPCKNCEAKMYKYECCSEDSGLCPDCCDELGACLNWTCALLVFYQACATAPLLHCTSN